MRLTIVFLFLASILITCNQPAKISETAQWRGPDRTGIYPGTNLMDEWPEDGPEFLWEADGLGVGYSSVAVANDVVYTSGTIDSVGYLFAFDVVGTLLWKMSYGDEWMENFPGIRSTPLVYDGKVYLFSGVGVLHCFSGETGEIIWETDLLKEADGRNIRFGLCENLVFDKDRIYVTPGGEVNNVVAVDKDSGEIVWSSKGNGEVSAYCSPRLIEHNGRQYFLSMTAKSFISIDIETAELVWTYPLNIKSDVHANTPYYRDGHVFVMDGYESGAFMLKIADDGKSVEELWRNDILDETNGGSIIVGDNIYISAESKKQFCCVDWNTGEVNYSIDTLAPATVIMADGMLYCCTYDGEFGILKPGPDSFELKGIFKYPKSKIMYIAHPVIKNGRLYYRHDENLFVYNVTNTESF